MNLKTWNELIEADEHQSAFCLTVVSHLTTLEEKYRISPYSNDFANKWIPDVADDVSKRFSRMGIYIPIDILIANIFELYPRIQITPNSKMVVLVVSESYMAFFSLPYTVSERITLNTRFLLNDIILKSGLGFGFSIYTGFEGQFKFYLGRSNYLIEMVSVRQRLNSCYLDTENAFGTDFAALTRKSTPPFTPIGILGDVKANHALINALGPIKKPFFIQKVLTEPHNKTQIMDLVQPHLLAYQYKRDQRIAASIELARKRKMLMSEPNSISTAIENGRQGILIFEDQWLNAVSDSDKQKRANNFDFNLLTDKLMANGGKIFMVACGTINTEIGLALVY